MLGPQCQTLATAVVHMYGTEPPHHDSWCKIHSGVASLTKDVGKVFIQVDDSARGQRVFEQEIHREFSYYDSGSHFHHFKSDEKMIGFNFVDKADAKTFLDAVIKQLFKRRRRSEGHLGQTQHQELQDRDKDFSQYNEYKEFGNGLRDFFRAVGLNQQQMEDRETRKYVYDFIIQSGGVEEAKREYLKDSSRNTAQHRPFPAPPPPLEEFADGIHPIDPGEIMEDDLSYPSAHDAIAMVVGKEILETKNMGLIHKAARDGRADEVLKLSEKGEDLSALTGATKNTPLHYAAYEGHTDVVELLLHKQCDPNPSNATGDTPLHLSALTGKADVVERLSDCEDIDVNNSSATSETLLVYAREESHMLDVLRNPETISPEGNTPLHYASLAGHTEVVKLLLMKKADVKRETPTHHTALHYAALRGDAVLVKVLILHGADPNAKDERSTTPLHYAALCGHTSVVELLVEERADINIRTDMGLSVLHKASFYGRLSTAQKLVELEGTLVDTRDKENLSAEDTALIRGHVHTAWWLNKNARQADLQDQKHLMNICMSRYKQSGDFYHAYCREKNASAEALATAVDFGVCDMHYQDERGRTLLHVAAEQGDRPKIGVLLERGALPTARTHDGKTPSDLAREKGHLEAAKAIADEVKVEETDREKTKLYTSLLNSITKAAKANLKGDDKEQADRLGAVKEASSLLASGAPLEPTEGHSCYPLHLAIANNCTSLLPLLLAAGAPMTSSADSVSPMQLAWRTQDITTWVGVVVTRAVIHKILMEMSLLDADLQPLAKSLVNSLEGKKPWDAKVSITENSAITLDSLLFRACANGATTFAWWIWHSGGSAVSQNKDKRTPLHAALDSGHLDTATNLVLHMGANLFLPDNVGRAPVDHIPDVTRRQILKASLVRECRRLADESEKAREPTQKQEAKQFVLLLLSLYSEYSNTLCWKTVFGWLNYQLSESDDWMEKLVYDIRNQNAKDCEDEGSASKFCDVTCNDLLELITENRAKYSVFKVKMANTERDMPMNTLSKIVEKAVILSCGKEFPLFLHLLVQVGGQKVNQELEVCWASPLHYAALKNNASAARYLVSHGASVEAKDRFGNTPAHYACMYGYKDLGDFLRTGQVNRCGLTAMDLLDGYKNYLKLYELDSESLLDIDMQKTNTGPQRTKALLNEFKKKWEVSGIGEGITRIHVNYSKGESKVIKTAVFNLVKSVQNSVAKKNSVFNGELLLLGSSADNVRLFCPDEFDCNIVLSNLHGFGNGDLQVSLQEVGLSYTGCRTKINVSSNSQGIIPLLKGSNFLHTFYNLVKECIANFEPEDERIAIIPPGYFDKIFFKISSPKGFVLKNTFFLELQEFTNSLYWADHINKRIRTVFERMCDKDTKEPVKIEAYFAGGTEASCLGHGASEIVKFFTPKFDFNEHADYLKFYN
nr:serine/threonine-protein phosphatase 6 regulatory ankyrin repeat subunit A-like [Penaeus vannamei]